MASEDMGLVQAQQRLNNGLNHPQHVFQDTFSCGPPPQRRPAITSVADPGVPKATTRELTGEFMDHHRHHHYFHQPTPADFRGSMFSSAAATSDPPHRDNSHTWNASRASTTPSGDGSEDDDVEDDDDNDDNDNDDENEVEGLVAIDDNDNNNNNNNSNNNNNNNTVNCNDKINSTNNSSDKLGNQKSKHLSSFGMKEGNAVGQCGNDSNNSEMRNAVTVSDVDGEMYYSQYLQGTTEVLPNSGQKDTMVVENVCGFSGRKDGVYSSESGESLRTILSDPSTGALMDDAMILPCGHSFGSGGMQHVLRMKACCTCSQAVSEDSVSPNLSLRAAVLAFRREKELQVNRASKRRRERYEQDKGTYGDSGLTYHPRGRGVQFPFVVTDRVIIKGNKRTPPRFVGREAIVTMQCLNGWYVVKTLDNAESVKLQYRSLAKVPDNQCLKPISSKITPDWL